MNILIRKLQTIGSLTESEKAFLLGLPSRVIVAKKGTVIAADGAVASRSCLVLEGFAHREKLNAAGGRQIFSFHPAGDIPDLQNLHLGRMDHNLVATSDCRVALIDHRDLNAVLGQSASLTGIMWRDCLIDAASFRQWMLMLGQADAETRMAHLFCELFVRLRVMGLNDGLRFNFPATQTDIGDALGISAVHTNRTLQELRGEGLIAVDRTEVEILNWSGLRARAMFDGAYLHYTDSEEA